MSRTAEYIHVSVAWPYANGDLHVGHLAGVYLPADIFARYHRLRGNHVLMVSGSDAHGTPISVEADRRGLPAEAIFEHYHQRFLRTQQKLGISYDLFTHTDTETHHRIAQNIFSLLLERDYLYREEQALLYSELENRFLPDRYVEGECYLCGFEGARGDQCDNCSQLLDATMLINPRNRAHPDDRLVVRRSEHYFLDLSQTSAALLDYLARNQAHWRSNVHSFTRNLILRGEAEGLRGRAYTRDLDWGIRVPLPAGRTSASTCGSRRSTVTSPPAWNGRRTRADPRPGRTGGTTRTPKSTTSSARTTSLSIPSSGPRCCSASTAFTTRPARRR